MLPDDAQAPKARRHDLNRVHTAAAAGDVLYLLGLVGGPGGGGKGTGGREGRGKRGGKNNLEFLGPQLPAQFFEHGEFFRVQVVWRLGSRGRGGGGAEEAGW